MNFPSSFRILIPLLCVVMVNGCAQKPMKMYSGKELAPVSVAVVQSSGALKTVLPNAASVVVTAINGKATNFKETTGQHAFAVLPAEYELQVHLSRKVDSVIAGNTVAKQYITKKSLKFSAMAGRTYKIYGSLYPQDTFPWYTWVEDVSNGSVVAGKKPDKR